MAAQTSQSCDLCQSDVQSGKLQSCLYCQKSYCDSCFSLRQKIESMGPGKGSQKGTQSVKCAVCDNLALCRKKSNKHKNTIPDCSDYEKSKRTASSPSLEVSGAEQNYLNDPTSKVLFANGQSDKDISQSDSESHYKKIEQVNREQEILRRGRLSGGRLTTKPSGSTLVGTNKFGTEANDSVLCSAVENSDEHFSLKPFLQSSFRNDSNARNTIRCENLKCDGLSESSKVKFESYRNVFPAHIKSNGDQVSQDHSTLEQGTLDVDFGPPELRDGMKFMNPGKIRDGDLKTEREAIDFGKNRDNVEEKLRKQSAGFGETIECEELKQGVKDIGSDLFKGMVEEGNVARYGGAGIEDESKGVYLENDFGDDNPSSSSEMLQKAGSRIDENGDPYRLTTNRDDDKPEYRHSDRLKNEVVVGKVVQKQDKSDSMENEMRRIREDPVTGSTEQGHHKNNLSSDMIKQKVIDDQEMLNQPWKCLDSQEERDEKLDATGTMKCDDKNSAVGISSDDLNISVTGKQTTHPQLVKERNYTGDTFPSALNSSLPVIPEDIASFLLMNLLPYLESGQTRKEYGIAESSIFLVSLINSAKSNGVSCQKIIQLLLSQEPDALIQLLQEIIKKMQTADSLMVQHKADSRQPVDKDAETPNRETSPAFKGLESEGTWYLRDVQQFLKKISAIQKKKPFAGNPPQTKARGSNDQTNAYPSLSMLSQIIENGGHTMNSTSPPLDTAMLATVLKGQSSSRDKEYTHGAAMLQQLLGRENPSGSLSKRDVERGMKPSDKSHYSKYSDSERSDIMKFIFGPLLSKQPQTTRLLAIFSGGDSDSVGSQFGQGFQENAHGSPLKTETSPQTSERGYEGYTQSEVSAAYALMLGGYGQGMAYEDIMDALQKMVLTTQSLGFQIRDTSISFGDCMFFAAVDQLQYHQDNSFGPLSLRLAAIDFLRRDPCSEDGTHLKSFIDGHDWESYLNKMSQPDEWGDHIMLSAIANVTGRTMQVIHSDESRDWTVIEPKACNKKNQACVYLGHVAQLHYVSLRPSSDWKSFSERSDSAESGNENDRIDVPTVGLDTEEERRSVLTLEYIDDICGLPMFHLSYLMKRLVNKTEIYDIIAKFLEYFSMKEIEQSEQSTTKFTGSTVEGFLFAETMAFYLGDKNVCTTLSLCFLCEKSKGCVREPGDDEKGPSDLVMDISLVHPGYVKLVHSATQLWGCYGKRWADAVTTYYPNYYIMMDKMYGHNYHGFNEKNRKILFQHNEYETYGMAEYQFVLRSVWPEVARKWKTRQRRIDWPTQEVRDQIVQDGCHLIPIAHKHSMVPDIEWRICFSVAEKKIANQVVSFEQRYCFVILKGLCRNMLNLSSGHLKSIFFSACENIEQDIWADNPAGCVLYMIQTLLEHVQQGNLPNYFIPENNMIDELDEGELQKLMEALQNLRQHPLEQVQLLGSASEEQSKLITDMVSAIQQDVEQFRSHRNMKLTVSKLFIPLAVSEIRTLIKQEQWQKASYMAREILDERKFIAQQDEDITMETLVPDLMVGLNVINQWWFCLHLNNFSIKKFMNIIFANYPCRTLADLIGPDVAGPFADLLVPIQFQDYLCSFCCNFCYFWYYKSRYNVVLPILHFCVDRYKQQVQTGTDEEFSDFTPETLLTIYTAMFYVYSAQKQLAFFQDYLKDVESLVKEIGTPEAMETLSIFSRGIENEGKTYKIPTCNCAFHRYNGSNYFQ